MFSKRCRHKYGALEETKENRVFTQTCEKCGEARSVALECDHKYSQPIETENKGILVQTCEKCGKVECTNICSHEWKEQGKISGTVAHTHMSSYGDIVATLESEKLVLVCIKCGQTRERSIGGEKV
jgi:predicted nucleic-acid-binding Zn-ribbon protein